MVHAAADQPAGPVTTRSRSTRVRHRLASLRLWIDDVRIREHLRRVERDLRRSPPDGLTPAQRRRRERVLDHLREYSERGRFPRARTGDTRRPLFVDADGTHCAVGYLMAKEGRADLVAHIMGEDPTVRLENLEDPAVAAWLDRVGLTREEAARIQPLYPSPVQFATTCGAVPCWLAGLLASLVAVATFAGLEYAGYRLVAGLFPGNTFKRRSALGYLTVANLFLAPLIGLLLFALFP